MKQQSAPRSVDESCELAIFSEAVRVGDVAGLEDMVRRGFDLRRITNEGDTLLEVAIRELPVSCSESRLRVVKALIEMGADARQRNAQGFGPLFAAVLDMDTALLRMLIDAGADPDKERIEEGSETLYDWAEFDYRFEVWNLSLPQEPTAEELLDDDAWLRFLDRLAVEYGKVRPLHLQLLRQSGFRGSDEQSRDPCSSSYRSREQDRHQIALRIDVALHGGGPEPDGSDRGWSPYTTVLVNGEEIESQHLLDVSVMLDSLKASGRHEVFTCGCGVARVCGANFHGVEVEHLRHGLIRWTVQRPQCVFTDDEPYDGSLGPEVTSVFVFQRKQIEAELLSWENELRQLCADRGENSAGWPKADQSMSEVLDELEALRFEIGRRVHAR